MTIGIACVNDVSLNRGSRFKTPLPWTFFVAISTNIAMFLKFVLMCYLYCGCESNANQSNEPNLLQGIRFFIYIYTLQKITT